MASLSTSIMHENKKLNSKFELLQVLRDQPDQPVFRYMYIVNAHVLNILGYPRTNPTIIC